ncbi:MAG: ester cyclase [Ktedonobacteraceae bacterium]
MPVEENKAIVRRYLDEAWNKQNVNILDELMTPDYARYVGTSGAHLDREGQKQRLAGLHKAFGELQLVLDDILAEGDEVTIRIRLIGTHRDTFMGVPATGKQITIVAIDILRLVDGKVAEHWGVMDTYGALQQLGAIS